MSALFAVLLGWCAVSILAACAWSLAVGSSTRTAARRGPRDRRRTVRRTRRILFPPASNPHPCHHAVWHVSAESPVDAWRALEAA